MKKFILSLLLIAAIGISSSFTSIENNTTIAQHSQLENLACKYNQCHATAKSTGKRCKHCVSNSGDRYCYQHD